MIIKKTIRGPRVVEDRVLKIQANRQSTQIHELTMMKPSTTLIKPINNLTPLKSVEPTENNNLALV